MNGKQSIARKQKYCCSIGNRGRMKEKEFGSNFCEELSKCNRRLDNNDRALFFDSGRSAIRYLLDYLGERVRKVMLPQYICESVLNPFVERGYEIVYYSINKRFELCKENFIELVEKKRPQLILVQEYFGFDTLNMERNFLKELKRQGIIVVEDVTHNFFSNDWKSCANFMVGSIRKWCSIPDGGLLVGCEKWAQDRISEQLLIEENRKFISKRIAAQMEKRKYNVGCSLDKKRFITLFEESEAILDKQKKYYSMSLYTRERIRAIDWREIAFKRKKNYQILKNILKDIEEIEIPYCEESGKWVPLYCPVYIKQNKRNTLHNTMRDRNIFLPIIWPIPSMLVGKITEEVKEVYDTILAIPCDQRYAQRDMVFIANAIVREIT